MTVPDLTDVFRQEARELLETIEQALLDLELGSDDRELVDSTFRGLHTLKGSGAMFGFDEVAAFVHEFETAFDRVRKGQTQISPALIAVALRAKDHIHKLVEEPGRHAKAGVPILDALKVVAANPAAVPVANETLEIAAPAGGIRQHLADKVPTSRRRPGFRHEPPSAARRIARPWYR